VTRASRTLPGHDGRNGLCKLGTGVQVFGLEIKSLRRAATFRGELFGGVCRSVFVGVDSSVFGFHSSKIQRPSEPRQAGQIRVQGGVSVYYVSKTVPRADRHIHDRSRRCSDSIASDDPEGWNLLVGQCATAGGAAAGLLMADD
jgi:hypothetical protein